MKFNNGKIENVKHRKKEKLRKETKRSKPDYDSIDSLVANKNPAAKPAKAKQERSAAYSANSSYNFKAMAKLLSESLYKQSFVKKYVSRKRPKKSDYSDEIDEVKTVRSKMLDYYGFIPKKGNPSRRHYLRML